MGHAVEDLVSKRIVSDRVRVSLNAVRALAAIYVVLHHLAPQADLPGFLQVSLKFGQEAVMVFFLLSGFLIYNYEKSRVGDNLLSYYLRRARRIYPALLMALALSVIISVLMGKFSEEFHVRDLILNIIPLQDLSEFRPGTIVDPFLGNLPLWSLSYEVLFYLVFPALMSVRKRSRLKALVTVGSVSVLGYLTYYITPNHFSIVFLYLLVWWAGAFVADLYSQNELSLKALSPLIFCLLVVFVISLVGYFTDNRDDMAVFLRQALRLFGFTLLCILIAGSKLATVVVQVTSTMPRVWAYLASISYGLYLFHYPLLVQWEPAHSMPGFVVALALLIGLSVVGDRWLEQILPKPGARSSKRTVVLA